MNHRRKIPESDARSLPSTYLEKVERSLREEQRAWQALVSTKLGQGMH